MPWTRRPPGATGRGSDLDRHRDLMRAWPKASFTVVSGIGRVRCQSVHPSWTEGADMASTPTESTGIVGGVDTHQDLHTAAIVNREDSVLSTESFSTTRAGYRAMLAWFRSHGELLRVGVESTGSYGAGIGRHLALFGVPVLEVTGPDPAARRARGKKTTHSMRSPRPRRLARDVESKWPRIAAARWRPRGCCARLARPRSSAAGRPCSSSTTRSSPRRTRCATKSATSPACGVCASANGQGEARQWRASSRRRAGSNVGLSNRCGGDRRGPECAGGPIRRRACEGPQESL